MVVGSKLSRAGGADLELCVGLGGELRGLAVGANAGPMALAVLVVAEVPDPAAQIRLDLTDAERSGCVSHGVLGEFPRYKTPQTAHKRGTLGPPQKSKYPQAIGLWHTGRQASGEGGIRTPETGFPV